MNKNEFLEKLGTHLVILADQEQQDILAEYSQHIDMKIKNGLSEEEAIRDFGEIHDLAAEILEAYHVNPGYQTASPEKDGQTGKAAAQAGRNLLPHTLSAGIKKAASSTCHMISACFRQCGAAIKAFLRALASPWRKLRVRAAHPADDADADSGVKRLPASRPVPEASRTSRTPERPARPAVMSRAFHSLGAFLADSCSMLLRFLCWCIRLCWNITMILLAFFSGLLTLTVLFFLGAVSMWLFQGYPLLGITLAGLGLILCGGSFTFFCVSLILRKRGQDAGPPQKTDREPEAGTGGTQKEIRKETHLETREEVQHA